ncbi:MAG: hypothetical protein EXR75_08020 [Myxococcales bacterium]|nr:hypothetical protein [Myxococcales bacterium]
MGAAAFFFARQVHAHYPLRHWLFWRYAAYIGLSLFWALGCVSAGHYTLVRLLGRTLPMVEQLATSFAVGVFEFFFFMSLAGFAQLYEPWFFPVLPAAMIAIGARSLFSYVRRLRRHAAHHVKPVRAPWFVPLAVLFGCVSLALIYFAILTPDNIQFDARWKHLAVAEEYATYGGIRRFGEGWTVVTYPLLASILYTWAFTLPGARLFDKVELAAHVEMVGVLFSLVAIVGLTRRLGPALFFTAPHWLKNDAQGWQFSMSDGRERSPGEMYDLFRKLGATHPVWEESAPFCSKSGCARAT